MVGMRVIEADDVFSAVTAFALDADQFLGIDVVAVVGRIGASVATARGRSNDAGAIVFEAAEEDTAAFVGICFFPALADCVVIFAFEFQHGSKIKKVKTPTLSQRTREGWGHPLSDTKSKSHSGKTGQKWGT